MSLSRALGRGVRASRAAAARRATSGSFGHAVDRAAAGASGGGRVMFGGTTSGARSR